MNFTFVLQVAKEAARRPVTAPVELSPDSSNGDTKPSWDDSKKLAPPNRQTGLLTSPHKSSFRDAHARAYVTPPRRPSAASRPDSAPTEGVPSSSTSLTHWGWQTETLDVGGPATGKGRLYYGCAERPAGPSR